MICDPEKPKVEGVHSMTLSEFGFIMLRHMLPKSRQFLTGSEDGLTAGNMDVKNLQISPAGLLD
jgi:hypothetical protein